MTAVSEVGVVLLLSPDPSPNIPEHPQCGRIPVLPAQDQRPMTTNHNEAQGVDSTSGINETQKAFVHVVLLIATTSERMPDERAQAFLARR